MSTPAEIAWERILTQIQPLGPKYVKFHNDQREAFLEMPASVSKHHCWPGGYAEHVQEVIDNIVNISSACNLTQAKMPDMKSRIRVAYVHDLDKLLGRYERDNDGPTSAQIGKAKSMGISIHPQECKASLSKKIDAAVAGRPIPDDKSLPKHKYNPNFPQMDDAAAVVALCWEFGLDPLSPDEIHAISLHHGGWAPLAKHIVNLEPSPLAAMIHAADLLSACINGVVK